MLVRCYLANDSGVLRGATTQGGLKYRVEHQMWFDPDNGMIIENTRGKISCHHYSNLKGDSTFKVYFFQDNFDKTKFLDILGFKETKKKNK